MNAAKRRRVPVRILHIASFVGNIGDNASHLGFREILNRSFPKYSIERVEIRKFYKNYSRSDRCRFDADFVRYVNKFDLAVIGGGGYLDYWVDSATGTTIDIDPVLVEEIRAPLLITSVGCFPHREVPEGNVAKLRRFLDTALSRSNIRIAIRNDGSRFSFEREVGSHYLNVIPEVLDSGFFFQPTAQVDERIYGQGYICLNVTKDQIRMKSLLRGPIDEARYLEELRSFIIFVTKQLDLRVVLVPHIYSDLVAISRLLENLDDFLLRTHVVVAPYVQFDSGANYLFGVYRSGRAIVGTRFHSNVCGLAMGRPTVGLLALDRVKYMFDSVGLPGSYVRLDEGFSEQLKTRLSRSIEIAEDFSVLEAAKERTFRTYCDLFGSLGLA